MLPKIKITQRMETTERAKSPVMLTTPRQFYRNRMENILLEDELNKKKEDLINKINDDKNYLEDLYKHLIDVNAMIDWMNSECPFDIAADYFESIEKSSGYEIMREEVISNYIRRNLMYMIDQTDTKKAAHWYEIWHRMCSW